MGINVAATFMFCQDELEYTISSCNVGTIQTVIWYTCKQGANKSGYFQTIILVFSFIPNWQTETFIRIVWNTITPYLQAQITSIIILTQRSILGIDSSQTQGKCRTQTLSDIVKQAPSA